MAFLERMQEIFEYILVLLSVPLELNTGQVLGIFIFGLMIGMVVSRKG